jgi:hypothetical protein
MHINLVFSALAIKAKLNAKKNRESRKELSSNNANVGKIFIM